MNTWQDLLTKEFEQEYFKNIIATVHKDKEVCEVYPPTSQMFTAFNLCPLDQVKVVILGQDPYHQPRQAHGLAFSVSKSCPVPPSLRNIYKELHSDVGIDVPNHGSLVSWAKQGVLLLNTSLSVRHGEPNSHKDIGWDTFTKHIIQILNKHTSPIVFILWGKNATSKRYLITNEKHLILEAAHPSPLSAYNGFFGCKHFSKTNTFLTSNKLTTIDWSIKNT